MIAKIVSKAGFAAIARGLSVPLPKKVRAFHQHARTTEEIRKRGINVVIDAGANRGFYSQHLRECGFKGTILSFEPVEESFAELAGRAKNDASWRVFKCALGPEPGEINFNVIRHGNELVMSSALQPNFNFETTQTKVPVRTLLDVLGCEVDASARVFLKMDTQGYDLEVFKGGGNHPSIVMLQSEIAVFQSYHNMPFYFESLAKYHEAGFRLLDTFLVGRHGDFIGEMDALMARGQS